MATKMLRTNPKCEDLDEKRIQKYAGKMDSGRWKWNGTPLARLRQGWNDPQEMSQTLGHL